MLLRGWPRSRLVPVWLATTLVLYFVLSIAALLARRPIKDAARVPQPTCRRDMQVNLLPPMPDDDHDMLRNFFTYLSRPHRSACGKVARIGGKAFYRVPDQNAVLDGHKFVCMDPEFSIHTTDDCLVYSIGISTDWSFDWEMEGFGCTVFAFDPTVNAAKKQNGTITFLQYGVGAWDHATEHGWQIRTLDTFVQFLGHAERTIHYLKMDVEFAEWEVLRQQAVRDRASPLFRNVQQLGVELHFTAFLPFREHLDFYRESYKTLLALQDMGFYLFSYEPNFSMDPDMDVPGMDEKLVSAMEVVWVKSSCANQFAALQES